MSKRNIGDKIRVVAIGAIPKQVLDHLCPRLAQSFGCGCEVGKPMPAPTYAFNAKRGQYAAEPILNQITPGEAERILGVVDLDLFVPDLNFVFGLADRFGRRALIALPRLRQGFYDQDEDQALFLARCSKEAVHELGHTYGLGHCRDRHCVMAFSNSLADTDAKAEEFCPSCARRLPM